MKFLKIYHHSGLKPKNLTPECRKKAAAKPKSIFPFPLSKGKGIKGIGLPNYI
jgi:hypothetical protein